ncbi:MAG: hypothetical protein HYU28_10135 [Actinobacteria bacterium]|nr:hypothetical protein [Actinomycetota bacterium]
MPRNGDGLTEAQRRVWRRLGPAGRIHLAPEMSEETRRIALAGLQARHPELGAEELQRVLVRRLYAIGPARP